MKMKFDKKTRKLLPQKIKYAIKHDEVDEEIINKYIENECNFRIEYENESPKFTKKNNRKEGK